MGCCINKSVKEKKMLSNKVNYLAKTGLTLLVAVLFAVLVLPAVNAKAEEDDPNAPVGTMTVTDSKTRTTNTTGSSGKATHDWVAGVDHSTDGDGVVDDSDGDDDQDREDCTQEFGDIGTAEASLLHYLNMLAEQSRYEIRLYDENGKLIASGGKTTSSFTYASKTYTSTSYSYYSVLGTDPSNIYAASVSLTKSGMKADPLSNQIVNLANSVRNAKNAYYECEDGNLSAALDDNPVEGVK